MCLKKIESVVKWTITNKDDIVITNGNYINNIIHQKNIIINPEGFKLKGQLFDNVNIISPFLDNTYIKELLSSFKNISFMGCFCNNIHFLDGLIIDRQ